MQRQVHQTSKNMVLNNIYKGYYDIPNEERARKPDMVMTAVVN